MVVSTSAHKHAKRAAAGHSTGTSWPLLTLTSGPLLTLLTLTSGLSGGRAPPSTTASPERGLAPLSAEMWWCSLWCSRSGAHCHSLSQASWARRGKNHSCSAVFPRQNGMCTSKCWTGPGGDEAGVRETEVLFTHFPVSQATASSTCKANSLIKAADSSLPLSFP